MARRGLCQNVPLGSDGAFLREHSSVGYMLRA